MRLFEGTGGYGNGEQRRDFVSVEDVVRVNLDFLDHPERSGIFNLGSGGATTFNRSPPRRSTRVARRRRAALSVPELSPTGQSYVPFPPALAGKYQSYTEADLTRMRAAGYRAPMLSVADGVSRYVEWLDLRERPPRRREAAVPSAEIGRRRSFLLVYLRFAVHRPRNVATERRNMQRLLAHGLRCLAASRSPRSISTPRRKTS